LGREYKEFSVSATPKRRQIYFPAAFWEGDFGKASWGKAIIIVFVIENFLLLGIHLLSIETLYIALPLISMVTWATAILVCAVVIKSYKYFATIQTLLAIPLYVLPTLQTFFLLNAVTLDLWSNIWLALCPALTLSVIPFVLGDDQNSYMPFVSIAATAFSMVVVLGVFPFYLYPAGLIPAAQWWFTAFVILLIIIIIVLTVMKVRGVVKSSREPVQISKKLHVFHVVKENSLEIYSLTIGIYGYIAAVGVIVGSNITLSFGVLALIVGAILIVGLIAIAKRG
jgi:hypothetical protein